MSVICSGDLLSIQPTQLKFSFELEKWISSSSMQLCSTSLQLTNKTDEYVAFKFKSDECEESPFNPNRGIVLPGTTCNVIVNMQASKEALHDMHCEDTFLIQSFIAPKGVKEKDITPEMFEKESGKVVKEFKFGVIYVPANPLVPEGSEKGSSHKASCVENGIQETYLLDAITWDAPDNEIFVILVFGDGISNGFKRFESFSFVLGTYIFEEESHAEGSD